MPEKKARKIKAFKTAVFSVENLSIKKQNIIDTQMRLAEAAYYKALSKVAYHIEPMLKLDKNGRKDILIEINKQVSSSNA